MTYSGIVFNKKIFVLEGGYSPFNLLFYYSTYMNDPYNTISTTENPEENYEFSTSFLQAFSEMQNDILKISSRTKNVRFSASRGAQREYPENIP